MLQNFEYVLDFGDRTILNQTHRPEGIPVSSGPERRVSEMTSLEYLQ